MQLGNYGTMPAKTKGSHLDYMRACNVQKGNALFPGASHDNALCPGARHACVLSRSYFNHVVC